MKLSLLIWKEAPAGAGLLLGQVVAVVRFFDDFEAGSVCRARAAERFTVAGELDGNQRGANALVVAVLRPNIDLDVAVATGVRLAVGLSQRVKALVNDHRAAIGLAALGGEHPRAFRVAVLDALAVDVRVGFLVELEFAWSPGSCS